MRPKSNSVNREKEFLVGSLFNRPESYIAVIQKSTGKILRHITNGNYGEIEIEEEVKEEEEKKNEKQLTITF